MSCDATGSGLGLPVIARRRWFDGCEWPVANRDRSGGSSKRNPFSLNKNCHGHFKSTVNVVIVSDGITPLRDGNAATTDSYFNRMTFCLMVSADRET
jgi:hypothetical protein